MPVDFEYTDEEYDYYIGVAEAISYYKSCHKAGFTIYKDEPYYIDLSDYNFTQGYGIDTSNSESKIYSLFKMYMSKEGYVNAADNLYDNDIDDLVELGLPDSRNVDPDISDVAVGYYVYIDSPYFKKYLSNRYTFENEKFKKLLKEINDIEEIEVMALEGSTIPNILAIPKEDGLYLYIADVMLTAVSSLIWDVLKLMKYVKSKADGKQRQVKNKTGKANRKKKMRKGNKKKQLKKHRRIKKCKPF